LPPPKYNEVAVISSKHPKPHQKIDYDIILSYKTRLFYSFLEYLPIVKVTQIEWNLFFDD
jgi:hypothetical protein